MTILYKNICFNYVSNDEGPIGAKLTYRTHDNAVKFSKSEIKIDLISNKNKIQIIITDDGPGFPEDIIEVIGEPYIQSKSNQVSSNSGTGLGTFLGKTLLERKSARLFQSRGLHVTSLS